MKHYVIRAGLGLAILAVLLLHAAKILELSFLHRLEAISYDIRLRLTMPVTVFPDIVIVDIDEKSLAEEGRWPWGRDRLALLVDKLFSRYRAAVVGFDVVFAEKDESAGWEVLQALKRNQLRDVPQYAALLPKIRPQLDRDRRFANSLQGRPVVLGYYFTHFENPSARRTSGALPSPLFPAGAFRNLDTAFVVASGYGANLAVLQGAAANAGHFTPLIDFDGVTRRIPMLVEYQGDYYESLALAVCRKFLGVEEVVPVVPASSGDSAYTSMESLRLGDLEIPVDENVGTLVPYRGRAGSFKYVSAVDVIEERADDGVLAGKIVLVGATAPGLFDQRSTPVGSVYPGVEVHANMIAGILEQRINQKPAYVLGMEVVTILLAGILLALVLPRVDPLRASLITLAVLLLMLGANLAAWRYGNLVLPLAPILGLVVALFVIDMSYGFFVESRAKRRISNLFGQYVPPALVDEMSKNPEAFDMKGESREMTVLFSDIRGFTTISENLDPRQLTLLMDAYLTPMTQVIHKHRGTIDKYIGDAIMAFWGAPLPDPQHARHAVLAALEMRQSLGRLMQEFRARGWPELKIGIGINTGVMSVGNMGSQFRKAYTVIGDAVNLASRLEGATKEYGVTVIVGEKTRKAAPGIVYRELDRVRVKGKREPVVVYEPMGLTENVGQPLQQEIAMFHEVLRHYRAREWDSATRLLSTLRERNDRCLLYRRYIERIEHLRANSPGEEWDGVLEFQTK